MNSFSKWSKLVACISLISLAACSGTDQSPRGISRITPESLYSYDMMMNGRNFQYSYGVTMSRHESRPDNGSEMAMDAVPESQLAEMRGGFALPSGLNINFGLDTSTAVNGLIVSNFNISGKNLNTVTPQTLQQIVQVGSNNILAASPAALNNNIVTVIQNNTNNVTIQSTSQLNLNVSNLASFRNNAAIYNSFGSLIRSIH